MNIAFLAYPQCSIWSLIGSYEIFQKTCRIEQLFPAKFKIKTRCTLQTVSTTNNNRIVGSYGNVFEADTTLDKVERPDLIVIPGFDRAVNEILADKETIAKLLEFYNQGTDIATICTGSFLLASTGLLDGQMATTHWFYAREFANRFPKIRLATDRIIIDHDRIAMCGGATSFQNLMIYLIEKYMSKELAIYMAKVLLIDNERFSQSPYSMFNGQKDHGDHSVLTAQQTIESRINEFISVDELAEITNMSNRNFLRRFKQATGDTPFVYMQRTKIEAAKNLMEDSSHQFLDIALLTGYTDLSSFRKSFKKYTGLSPMEYRKKYTYFYTALQ